MNSVQQKILCVYETGVADEPSKKRPSQPYKVTATRNLSSEALSNDVSCAKATEKFDGTCCLITEFKGQPWLWARHDRRPTKVGERRFAQFKKVKSKFESEGRSDETHFEWDPSKDFKDVPENWIPAHGLEIENGIAMPDTLGHTPGWVPVLPSSRQYCWHLEVVNFSSDTALLLRQNDDSTTDLHITSQPLSQLSGQTYELIGTNINGNPYGLGTKKCPFHILVAHGSLPLTCPDPVDYDSLVSWLTSDSEVNQVEGIVWHCSNGKMFKLHRHHLNLRWPDKKKPFLCQRKVKVDVSVESFQEETMEAQTAPKSTSLFTQLSSLNGQEFDSLHSLCQILLDQQTPR